MPDAYDFGDSLGIDLGPEAGEPPGPEAPPSAPRPGGSIFGAGLFGRSRALYESRPTNEDDNPIEDRVQALKAGRQKLQQSINNPLRAFLLPDEYKADLEQAARIDKEILDAKQAVQNQEDLREKAKNFGLSPVRQNALGATATDKTLFNATVSDFAEGRFTALNALRGMGEDGKSAIAQHTNDFMANLESRNSTAQSVVEQLDNAAKGGDRAYASVKAELDARYAKQGGVSGVLRDYVPNITVPDKAEAWNVRGKAARASLAQGQQAVSQWQGGQMQYGDTMRTPVTDEHEIAAVKKGQYGDRRQTPIDGALVKLNKTGEYANVISGGRVLENFTNPVTGKGTWNFETPENLKQLEEMNKNEQVKAVPEEFRRAKKFRDIAKNDNFYTTAAGVTAIKDQFSAVERSVSANSNASGNAQLARIFDTSVGGLGELLNKGAANASEVADFLQRHSKNATVREDGVVINKTTGQPFPHAPRLSPNTIRGFKDVANFGYDLAAADAKTRLNGPAYFAGSKGISLDKLGWDSDLQQIVAPAAEQGRRDTLEDIAKHPAIPSGDDRLMLIKGSTNPDASKTPLVKDRADVQRQQSILPSPGHENPPPNGAVLPPTGGTSKDAATVQLAWAKSPDNPFRGIASPVVAPTAGPGGEPAPFQPNITPAGASFLRMIRGSEANGDNPNSYNLIVGGQRFTQYDDHPRTFGTMGGRAVNSTAAGSYQFTKTTWDEVAAKFGPSLDRDANGKVPFTPQNQDKAAWYLAQDVYSRATKGGNLEADLSDPAKHGQVMAALNKTWTSLPGGKEPNNSTASRVSALRGYLANARQFADKYLMAGVEGDATDKRAASQAALDTGVEALPAIGSTVGAVAGGVAGGGAASVPLGMLGGSAGGALGQTAKNYLQGKELSESVGREAAMGAVQGIAPATKPLAGLAARVVGSGAVGGTEAALEGGDVGDIAFHAGVNAAGQIVGEGAGGLFGLALGKAGVMFGKFNPQTQRELVEKAETLAKGKPEAPKGVAGQPASDAQKAAHEAEVKAYDEAKQFAEAHNLDPEDLAHAAVQVKNRANMGEAVVSGAAKREEREIVGKGYQEIRSEVADKGVGAPKQKPLTNGPLSIVGKHEDVPNTQFAMDRAKQAENNITQPAKNWLQKYDQLFQERSKLLAEERDFLNGAQPDKNKARTVRAIADNVREQQEAAAVHVFGKERGEQVIQKLRALDKRYAILMDATHGGNIIENMRKPGEAGAKARAAFNNFAADDKGAQQMANALLQEPKKGSSSMVGSAVKYGITAVAHAFGIHPVIAAMVVNHGPKLMEEWAVRKVAGDPVTMVKMIEHYASQTPEGRAALAKMPLRRQQVSAAGGRAGTDIANAVVENRANQ